MPPLLFQKPLDQCTFTIAKNIAPIMPTAPTGVSRPSATSRQPQNSPSAAGKAQKSGGRRPILFVTPLKYFSPGLLNQPTNFIEPCAARVRPMTTRSTSKLKSTAISFTPLEKVTSDHLPATNTSVRRSAVALSSGRRLGPEEIRQFVGAGGESEHRPVRLQCQASCERPGINSVESHSIDQLYDCCDRGACISRRSHGDAARHTTRTPALFELGFD